MMYQPLPTISQKKLGLTILFLSLIFPFFPRYVYAQSASSLCVITKVGAPTGTPPELPAHCYTSGGSFNGKYFFPLKDAGVVTAVNTEMGSYPGGYTFGGHVEHAGLDIMTPVKARVPVHAITNGEVVESGGNACPYTYAGCRIRVKHSTDNFISIYTHTNPSVRVGDQVSEGEQIGIVHWWPEYSAMDHLHFELREQGTDNNINPRNYFPELQRFPPSSAYVGGVIPFSASRLIILESPVGGSEWAEKFKFHPPCPGFLKASCWAQ